MSDAAGFYQAGMEKAQKLPGSRRNGGGIRFRLWQRGSSRSLAFMRVDVVEKILERPAGIAEAHGDSSLKLALQNFQSAIRSEDSLFDDHSTGTGPVGMAGDGHETCSGDFLLAFREETLGRDRGLHLQLLQKLIELLEHSGSPDVLAARLCLISEGPRESRKESCGLWIQLEAAGDSKEQAALRWGLGVAQLQQALLFTSRYLRQRLAQKNS
jgi:hypothetical protein